MRLLLFVCFFQLILLFFFVSCCFFPLFLLLFLLPPLAAASCRRLLPLLTLQYVKNNFTIDQLPLTGQEQNVCAFYCCLCSCWCAAFDALLLLLLRMFSGHGPLKHLSLTRAFDLCKMFVLLFLLFVLLFSVAIAAGCVLLLLLLSGSSSVEKPHPCCF